MSNPDYPDLRPGECKHNYFSRKYYERNRAARLAYQRAYYAARIEHALYGGYETRNGRRQEMLRLYEEQGMSPAEIAGKMGCSRNSVYQSLARARKDRKDGNHHDAA